MLATGFLPDPQNWHLWNDTLTLLDMAARRGGVPAWCDGDLLWIAVEDGALLGAVTSRLLADGTAEVKHIAGVNPARWLKQIDGQIEDWARAHGCPLIVSRGRRGWTPMVAQWGWQRIGQDDGLTLFEKRL